MKEWLLGISNYQYQKNEISNCKGINLKKKTLKGIQVSIILKTYAVVFCDTLSVSLNFLDEE